MKEKIKNIRRMKVGMKKSEFFISAKLRAIENFSDCVNLAVTNQLSVNLAVTNQLK